MKKLLVVPVSLLLLTLTAVNSWSCGTGTSTITSVAAPDGFVVQINSLNSAGQLTGSFYIPGVQDSHAFRWDNGPFLDLGTIAGSSSEGLAINSSGQIAGDGFTADFSFHAFITSVGSLVDLGTLGGSYSRPVAINEVGQVAGSSLKPDDNVLLGFLYANGSMTSLGDLGGNYSGAFALNNLGAVAGDSALANGEVHAFIYANGVMADIGTLGGPRATAYTLNDAGAAAGDSTLANGQTHAFVFSAGVMVDIGTLGGTFSSAFMINSNGQVIGYSTTLNDAQTHGFVYSGGLLTDLGTLGGDSSFAYANNNLGQIVGYATTATGATHAFLYQNGKMLDLNTVLPAGSGWELDAARFINDSGRIAGDGIYNGVAQPFIMDFVAGNNPPHAVAGPDQTVSCDSQVTLDGSLSNDPDQDRLSFEWSLAGSVLGTNVSLAVSLPLGTNVVLLKVTDPCGASSQASVVVRVVDTLPPAVSCPTPQIASAGKNCQAPIPNLLPLVNASDNCTQPQMLVFAQNPAAGTLVGLGSHPVTITATDSSGNVGTCTVLFTVRDTTPPAINSITASPCRLEPDKHRRVPVTLSVSASDGCDAAPVSRLVSVTSNQHLDRDDIEITGRLTVTLAAECDPERQDRTYTLTVECVDASGNRSTGHVTVTVSKDRDNGDNRGRTRSENEDCDDHGHRG